jgi:hypothetical protein
MPLTKGNAPCAVKVKASAVVLEKCSPQLRNTARYRGLFNAVLGACGGFVDAEKFWLLHGYAV